MHRALRITSINYAETIRLGDFVTYVGDFIRSLRYTTPLLPLLILLINRLISAVITCHDNSSIFQKGQVKNIFITRAHQI